MERFTTRIRKSLFLLTILWISVTGACAQVYTDTQNQAHQDSVLRGNSANNITHPQGRDLLRRLNGNKINFLDGVSAYDSTKVYPVTVMVIYQNQIWQANDTVAVSQFPGISSLWDCVTCSSGGDLSDYVRKDEFSNTAKLNFEDFVGNSWFRRPDPSSPSGGYIQLRIDPNYWTTRGKADSLYLPFTGSAHPWQGNQVVANSGLSLYTPGYASGIGDHAFMTMAPNFFKLKGYQDATGDEGYLQISSVFIDQVMQRGGDNTTLRIAKDSIGVLDYSGGAATTKGIYYDLPFFTATQVHANTSWDKFLVTGKVLKEYVSVYGGSSGGYLTKTGEQDVDDAGFVIATTNSGGVTPTDITSSVELNRTTGVTLQSSDVGGVSGTHSAIRSNYSLAYPNHLFSSEDPTIQSDVLTTFRITPTYLEIKSTDNSNTTPTKNNSFFGGRYAAQYLSFATANGNATYDRYWPDVKFVKDAVAGSTSSPLTTKGDIWGYSTTNARQPVGTNGYVLTSNSSQATGLLWSDLSTVYFPLAGGTLTGTGGAGFMGFPAQSSPAATPASGVNVYGTTNGLTIKGVNGFQRFLSFPGLTADRIYKFQNSSYTTADSAVVAANTAAIALKVDKETFASLTYGSTTTWDNGTKQSPLAKVTATASFTLAMTNVKSGGSGTLKLTTNTASAITISFDAGFTHKTLNTTFTTYTLPAATAKEYFLNYLADGTNLEWWIADGTGAAVGTIAQNGNAFGATMTVGTTDANNVSMVVNSTEKLNLGAGLIRSNVVQAFSGTNIIEQTQANGSDIRVLYNTGISIWKMYNSSGTGIGQVAISIPNTGVGFLVGDAALTKRYDFAINTTNNTAHIYKGAGTGDTRLLIGGAPNYSATTIGALLNIVPSTTSSASLNIATGSNPTSPNDGDMWFGTPYIFFRAGSQTQIITKHLTNTVNLDFTNTSAQSSTDLTMTVTGAATGDMVSLGTPTVSILSNSSYSAWVSAANTVTVRFSNYSSGSQDPTIGSFKVAVIKQ